MQKNRNKKHHLSYRATGPDQNFVAMDKFSCSIGTPVKDSRSVSYKPLGQFSTESGVESTCVFMLSDNHIKLSRDIGYFEKVVFDAVLTLWHRHKKFERGSMQEPLTIDLNDILRVIRNTKDVRWVSDTFRESVIDALRAIRGTIVKLECTAEFQARGKDAKKLFRCGTEASLLEIRLMTAEHIDIPDKRRAKDKVCKICIIAEPILYTYATQIKHYEQIDPVKFSMPEGRITSERVARYGYIKDRILLLARTKVAHETIMFSEIEKYALNRSYIDETRKIKQDLKDYVVLILESFKSHGVIKDWTPIMTTAKNGSSVMVGVTIDAISPRSHSIDVKADHQVITTDDSFEFNEGMSYDHESVSDLDLDLDLDLELGQSTLPVLRDSAY